VDDVVFWYIREIIMAYEYGLRVGWSQARRLSSDLLLMGVWMEGPVLAHRDRFSEALKLSPVSLEVWVDLSVLKLSRSDRVSLALARVEARIVALRCLANQTDFGLRCSIIVLSRSQRSTVA
jgi:hypothetical protein